MHPPPASIFDSPQPPATPPLRNMTCPHCSRTFQYKERAETRKADCPKCGGPVELPGTNVRSREDFSREPFAPSRATQKLDPGAVSATNEGWQLGCGAITFGAGLLAAVVYFADVADRHFPRFEDKYAPGATANAIEKIANIAQHAAWPIRPGEILLLAMAFFLLARLNGLQSRLDRLLDRGQK